ncbi:uncharacterized protein LOC129720005 [Wyeomyia smithii]|uniref:uncharacterized protein LOC129720005 n=1 Tax=Wyeomyia smithii TaxID=174621 RepID=UPI002467C1E0|nr:uncharacterized protein LOC129720005 [Wyeomyia smithii]
MDAPERERYGVPTGTIERILHVERDDCAIAYSPSLALDCYLRRLDDGRDCVQRGPALPEAELVTCQIVYTLRVPHQSVEDDPLKHLARGVQQADRPTFYFSAGFAAHMREHIASQNTVCVCTTKNNVNQSNISISSNNIYTKSIISTASTNNLTQFTCCECCCCNCVDALASGVNKMSINNTNVRKITTKPLSPQTTSEDFKIYLANIQFLQNASNLLSQDYIQNLRYIFEKSYYRSKIAEDHLLPFVKNKFPNLTTVHDVLSQGSVKFSKSTVSESADTDEDILTDEEQKKMILKIHQEFWDLPTNYQEKPMVFGSQSKNRYRTVLPNENSRLILEAEFGMMNEPYINANLIKGPDYMNNNYIATQGPMNNTIYEFWLMVYQNITKTAIQHGVKILEVEQKIVMLTDFVENNRQKCSIYFPLQCNEALLFSNTMNFDSKLYSSSYTTIVEETLANLETTVFTPTIFENYFLITNLGICHKNGYTMRKLLVLYGYQRKCEMLESRNAFIVYHYWFPDWPDHRSPDDIDVLLDMSLDILDRDCSINFKNNTNITMSNKICTLPIIHCSAGIGRTGCLLAILNGLSQMRLSFNNSRAEIEYSNDFGVNSMLVTATVDEDQQPSLVWKKRGGVCVDILGIVCNLRLQRGGMVQNSEQYELIHRALCLYLQKLGV